jgi:hypothetical protein
LPWMHYQPVKIHIASFALAFNRGQYLPCVCTKAAADYAVETTVDGNAFGL